MCFKCSYFMRFFLSGLGDCNAGLVADFGSEYAMLSTSNRYHSNIVATSSGTSAESNGTSGNVGEMNSSTGDQHTHYSHAQTNGNAVSSGTGSTANSSQLFHSHHNMGHFTPSAAAFISGTGYNLISHILISSFFKCKIGWSNLLFFTTTKKYTHG